MIPISPDKLILLDIETASAKENFSDLSTEWQQLWTQKISRTLPEEATAEEYYPQKAAIYAEFARVVCISFGYIRREKDGWKLRLKSICSENEKEVLQEFFNDLSQMHGHNRNWYFTGHNIKEFDIPFICRRMIVNGLPLPECLNFQNRKPWETPMLDTLHLWRFGDYKHYISLKLMAAVLGVPSPKDDIDGSMVGDVFWKEKDLQRIATYCEKDVLTVANIFFRLNNQPLLKEEQVERVG